MDHNQKSKRNIGTLAVDCFSYDNKATIQKIRQITIYNKHAAKAPLNARHLSRFQL